MSLQELLLVSAGGAIGTLVRFGVREWFQHFKWSASFPWHTFLVNILGSFVLGLVIVYCKNKPTWSLFLGVGVCGGFTTFSTFSFEAIQLLEEQRWLAAWAYILGSVVAGIVGVWIGLKFSASA